MLERSVEKSYATMREMLADRGEDVSSMSDLSPNDVAMMVASSSGVFSIDVPSCGHRIIYNLHPSFKLVDVKKLIADDALPSGTRSITIVTQDKATRAGRKGVEDVTSREVQFYDISELQFNISRHELVPEHVPIRDETEIESLVKEYRVKTRFQFPLIAQSDPMARYLALKPGQLVRIKRFSPSIGMHVFYRCCSANAANALAKPQ